MSASVRPVTVLVAPGPEVTRTTPTLPVLRTFGGMDRGLLVTDEDVPQLVLLEQRIIEQQHGTARIAELPLRPAPPAP